MPVEIERKFLTISHDFKKEASISYMIKQGFLNRDAERTVRVRIKNNKGFLTIKGKSTTNGLTRYEWEKEISLTDAEALFKLCEKGVIKKRRFEVNYEKHLFEIDEFFEDNEGLILAEVELSSEDESFKKPHWLGEEVTGDAKYYNSMLSKNPYKNWK